MGGCVSIGGPALCTAVALMSLLGGGVLVVLVVSTQSWLLYRRLRKPGHLFKSKSAVFGAIFLENLALIVHCALLDRVSPVLHLVFDYSQFLLFTCVFYYFTLHSFQIMGRMLAVRMTVYALTAVNAVYLSGFTFYIAVQMVLDEVSSYCKSTPSLSKSLAVHASHRLRSEFAPTGSRPVRLPLPQPSFQHHQ